MDELNIITLKWGTKYGPEYVNRMYNMVKRNLTVPFKFYCITENHHGINVNVNILPLKNPELTGWWHKLSIFDTELYGLQGQALFLDLDLVLVDNIDCFSGYPGDFCIIKDWLFDRKNLHMCNSSVMRFEIGKHAYIWHNFLKDKENIIARLPGDQDWITEQVNETFWPDEWCRSFKWDKIEDRPPKNCKIVVFHGEPNPPDALKGFGKFKPALWIHKHYQ